MTIHCSRLRSKLQKVLQRLAHLDLARYIRLKGDIVDLNGATSDVVQGEIIDHPEYGTKKVAVKRLRVCLRDRSEVILVSPDELQVAPLSFYIKEDKTGNPLVE